VEVGLEEALDVEADAFAGDLDLDDAPFPLDPDFVAETEDDEAILAEDVLLEALEGFRFARAGLDPGLDGLDRDGAARRFRRSCGA
jgi:hypothetical protein